MNNPCRFDIEVTMLSDWHIGTGTGRSGGTDSLVRRDAEDFPYIPGKTLTGVLRDACETVAASLQGNWTDCVDMIFGSQPAQNRSDQKPCPAALSLGSAHYPPGIRKLLRGKPVLKNGLVFVKPGVSIDRLTGCAREDFLRFEEMARKGAVLTASASLDLSGCDDDTRRRALALIKAGCKFANRLGGKRRRGAGSCSFTMRRADGDMALLQDDFVRVEAAVTEKDVPGENDQAFYKMIIRTLSPVCVMKRTTGNIVETLDYIPGTCLLPLISSRLGKSFVADAVKRGSLSVSNAYPSVEGRPAFPAPLCLFHEKNDDKKLYNMAQKSPSPDKRLKQVRQGYVLLDRGSCFKPKLLLTTHNTVQDDNQRPGDDGVYSMQAIAPNTEFTAFLQGCLPDGLEGQEWDGVRLGTARHTEYGAVSVRLEKSGPEDMFVPSRGSNGVLAVLLLSDVLLRDGALRQAPTIEALRLELQAQLDIQLEKECRYVAARQGRISSWQSPWGLPRPTLIGLKAGTYVEFSIKGGASVKSEKLQELSAGGIGERTAEGFGRLTFNPCLKEIYDEKTEELQDGGKADVLPEDKETLRLLQARVLRGIVSEAAVSLASGPEGVANRKSILGIEGSKPGNSQLGALRTWTAQLADDGANKDEWLGQVRAWHESLSDRNEEKKLWPASSMSKLEELLTDARAPWRFLDELVPWEQITVVADADEKDRERARLKEDAAPWALKSLVDAVVRAEARHRSREVN